MMRTTSLCVVFLLTITCTAQAGEPEGTPNPPPPGAPPAPATEAAQTPPPAPVAAAPPQPEIKPTAVAAGVPVPSEPQPYQGWGRGVRAPIYVDLMMAVGALGEDGSNRLTTGDSKILEGVGGVFRIGAVLGPNHRLGIRMQSFVRPTKKIMLDPGSDTTTTNKWGAVSFGYLGPEYIYDTNFGLYAGGSIGLAGAMSTRENDDDKNSSIERGSAGAAAILSLGYQWRANKWFALNAEIFGGLYHGIDDNENSMNGSLFGLAMGVGF